MWRCGFLALVLLVDARAVLGAAVHGAVILDASAPHGVRYIERGEVAGTLAWGSYDETSYSTTGWGYLDVHAGDASISNDTLAGYAAGYLEGAMTARFMHRFIVNTGCDAPNAPRLQHWLDDNWAWMQAQVAANEGGDPYWAHLGALLAQIDGMADGQSAVGGTLTREAIYNEIIGGDMHQLAALYGVSMEQEQRGAPLRRIFAPGGRSGKPSGHCSALIRVLPDLSDVFVAHTTWSGLGNMMRLLKRYDLPFPATNGGTPVPGRHTALSGYPAQMAVSSDDFYVLSSGLVTLETSLYNNNATRAREYGAGATHEVVLEWARNVLANRLATDGASWGALFSRYASGTYCNSWMVVDTHRCKPGQTPAPGALTVVEEMPGLVSVIDRTGELAAAGYWGSYNVASDPTIFNVSGAWELVDEYGGQTGAGAYYTLGNTSRARMFARDAPGVVDEAGLARLIRYNDYTRDPLSTLGCRDRPPYAPTNAIADRSDLAEVRSGLWPPCASFLHLQRDGNYIIPDLRYAASAGIDAKYTLVSWMRAGNLAAGDLPLAAQSGPTYDTQPTFNWTHSAAAKDTPHEGQPDVWRFPWVRQPWAS